MGLGEELKGAFLQQFGAWVRIESRCRSNDLSLGIQARIADPLWLLARQWQFGEFQGEDAGSPIRIDYSYATQPVDTCAIAGQVREYDPSAIPLETLVEREKPGLDWRSQVRIGQEWERSVRAALPGDAAGIIDQFRAAYPVRLPKGDEWDNLEYAARRFLTFMQKRVVDGGKLLQAYFDTAQSLPLFNDASDPANSTIREITEKLAERYRDYHHDPDTRTPSAWRSHALDYRFELNQPKPLEGDSAKTRLVAPSYRNGDLDWHTLSIEGGVSDKWAPHYDETTGTPTQIITRTPTRLSIGGTSLRWWAFEDATIDFGDLDVAKTDLAKLALMEFALIYGDDWYSVPATVHMSNLVKITGLTAHNVFGETESIRPARKIDDREDRCWDIYSLSYYKSINEYLFSWNEVPGNDNERLLEFLRQRYCIGGTETAEIVTLNSGKARKISFGDIVIDLRLDKERGLVIVESGGVKTGELIAKTEDGKFKIYRSVVGNVPGEPILFIPPAAGFREESKPLEEIHLLRDEGANMVWAIEKTILNQMGDPRDGFDAQRERIERRDAAEMRRLRKEIDGIRNRLDTETLSDEKRGELESQIEEKMARIEKLERGPYAPEKPANNAQLRYRLATKVPENWFPFIPVQVPKDFMQQPTVVRLQRAQMLRNTDDEEPTSIPALSRLLDNAADPLLWIEEHAIGRDGLRLQLTSQRVRWINGKTFVWLGRKVLTGKGEGSSGLRFDEVNGEQE